MGGVRVLWAVIALAGMAAAQDGEPVIRITTSLVQIDAIVTDRDGKLVTDLTAADFEILQDGKKRDLTAFSLVQVAGPRPAVIKPVKGALPTPPLPYNGVTRADVRRTVAILVDDMSIDFADMARLRDAIRRFIQETVGPGDLVSIMTARGGMGVYSQFTTDRALLLAAAEKLSWRGFGIPDVTTVVGYEEARALQAGSRGSILSAIRALREMPGRKSIVYFSSGSQRSQGENDPLLDRISDEATRAAVTLYAIDARGLQTLQATADGTGARSAASVFLSQGDMSLLAERTGGLFFRNDNGLRELLVQSIEDQSSYYLLGYNPGQGSFNRQFHKIEVRVLRRGLKVRSRTGYVGVEDRPERRPLEISARRTVRALLGPFQANDLHTQLTATFRADDNKPRVLAQLWIDGKDLTFRPWEGGKYRTEIEVVVANFDPQGALREHTERGYRVTLTPAQLEEMRRSGLLYSISYPAKKPGPYQVRVAVREISTEHVGTASQFLLTPDIGKERLALSGIIMTGLDDKTKDGDLSKPWMSLLRLDRTIEWQAQVFHPKLKKGLPELQTSLRLYRDGSLVRETKPEPFDVSAPLKKKQIDVTISGSVALGSTYPSGEYVLQLIVRDENDKSKAVTQSLAFQVVE